MEGLDPLCGGDLEAGRLELEHAVWKAGHVGRVCQLSGAFLSVERRAGSLTWCRA
jgi:hypothetical protein